MAIHLMKEIEGLKRKTLSLSTLVEENVGRAVLAFTEKNEKLARQVINLDNVIDTLEIEVEEECLKILALHQPVAVDLRFIVSVLKMNSDFERIGDLATNIAERALALAKSPDSVIGDKLGCMVERVRGMLKNSLDSLVNLDTPLAKKVCASDDEVDACYREMYDDVKKSIIESPANLDDSLQVLSTSRHLERIADHATNIAEDVIYLVDGEISRHRRVEKKN
jgi:phosphate transport system protein